MWRRQKAAATRPRFAFASVVVLGMRPIGRQALVVIVVDNDSSGWQSRWRKNHTVDRAVKAEIAIRSAVEVG
jgi:hypothetical protein